MFFRLTEGKYWDVATIWGVAAQDFHLTFDVKVLVNIAIMTKKITAEKSPIFGVTSIINWKPITIAYYSSDKEN